ncbi:MAG: ABC transporter permease, partial [Vicinamibacterales bacterium]
MTNIALDGDFAAARFTRGRAFLRWRGFRNTRVIAGGTGLLLIVICSVFGPWIAPREAEDTDFSDVLASPSLTSPLGTEHVGRDVFSRAIRGSKIALQVAIVTAAVGVTIGVTLGLTAGYIGGWTDRIIMTAIDTLLAFPALILILAMTAILGISLT